VYESVCYRKPFLKEVIVRVDLASTISAIDQVLPPKIANVALNHFPITEPKKVLEQSLQIGPAEFRHSKSEVTQWHYYGKNREKRLAIASASLLATYSKYTSYEDLKEDFLAVLRVFFETYPDARASRVGLRYINNIEIPSTNPFSWAQYIAPAMLGLLDFFQEREHLTRIFHIVEFRFEDLNVKFQFGLPNPEFPSVIKSPIFVLDLDGYVQGSQDFSEIGINIDLAHTRIQKLFEESVTEELRRVMRATSGT